MSNIQNKLKHLIYYIIKLILNIVDKDNYNDSLNVTVNLFSALLVLRRWVIVISLVIVGLTFSNNSSNHKIVIYYDSNQNNFLDNF